MIAPPSAFLGALRPSPSVRGKPLSTSRYRPREHARDRSTGWVEVARGLGLNGTTGSRSLGRTDDDYADIGIMQRIFSTAVAADKVSQSTAKHRATAALKIDWTKPRPNDGAMWIECPWPRGTGR